jgi:hypothetical protein
MIFYKKQGSENRGCGNFSDYVLVINIAVLFRKVAKGLDKKDFVIVQQEL